MPTVKVSLCKSGEQQKIVRKFLLNSLSAVSFDRTSSKAANKIRFYISQVARITC